MFLSAVECVCKVATKTLLYGEFTIIGPMDFRATVLFRSLAAAEPEALLFEV